MPKNDFGNIDLYVPTMLPAGAAHIPCEYRNRRLVSSRMFSCSFIVKGTAKIARQLGFDYAEAVVCSALSVRDDPH